jgi:hypothetical protein
MGYLFLSCYGQTAIAAEHDEGMEYIRRVFKYECNYANISLFALPRFARTMYMHLIDGCVSSQLIQNMCKSVQSSFDNSSVNTIYSCLQKLKWLGKGLLSLTKSMAQRNTGLSHILKIIQETQKTD